MSSNSHTTPTESLSLRNMLIVTAALAILLLRAAQIFGFFVLAMAVVSYISALAVELLFSRVRKKDLDNSWMVTPLVFTLLLPPATPLWMVAIGSAFGVFFGKAIFGGLGKNVFNPAASGILFLIFAFPQYMLTRWLNPVTQDVVSTATPLITLNRNIEFPYTHTELLFGNVPGTLGETFRLGILALGLLLVLLKIVDWRIPLSFVGTVFVLNLVGGMLFADRFRDPVLSVLVGGLLFGAFFVASDPVTSPTFPRSKLMYGFGLGLITVLIRNFGTHNEGVIFAVIIMNAVAPLLDGRRNEQRAEEGS